MNQNGRPFTGELAGFLESGLAIVIATRDDDLQPDGAPAWAVRVHPDLTHVTVYTSIKSGQAMLRNLDRHPEIAVVLDRPSTHRACQIKGVLTGSRRARPAERDQIGAQLESFRADLEMIGIPRAMTAGWKPWPCLALEIETTHVFEQTPGPGTGEPLR